MGRVGSGCGKVREDFTTGAAYLLVLLSVLGSSHLCLPRQLSQSPSLFPVGRSFLDGEGRASEKDVSVYTFYLLY